VRCSAGCRSRQNVAWTPFHRLHHGSAGGIDATAADTAWQSLIMSPAFPEYFSGHSMTSAAAELLELFFGRGDYSFELTAMPGMDMPGMSMPRMYDSFWQAAEEAGASRIYGGIHFQFSNEDGLRRGAVPRSDSPEPADRPADDEPKAYPPPGEQDEPMP